MVFRFLAWILGVVVLHRIDNDWSYAVLGRDEHMCSGLSISRLYRRTNCGRAREHDVDNMVTTIPPDPRRPRPGLAKGAPIRKISVTNPRRSGPLRQRKELDSIEEPTGAGFAW